MTNKIPIQVIIRAGDVEEIIDVEGDNKIQSNQNSEVMISSLMHQANNIQQQPSTTVSELMKP